MLEPACRTMSPWLSTGLRRDVQQGDDHERRLHGGDAARTLGLYRLPRRRYGPGERPQYLRVHATAAPPVARRRRVTLRVGCLLSR